MFATQPAPHHAFAQRTAAASSYDRRCDEEPLMGPTIQLPRTLARPAFASVSKQCIAAAAPELADVPVEYIRQNMKSQAPAMLAGLSSVSLPHTMPRSKMSGISSVPISVRSSDNATAPTHILAIAASKSNASSDVILVPTHAIVLAAACTSLPPLDVYPQTPGASTSKLPVLAISLPAPSAFPALHAFLYTRSRRALLSSLLPGLDPAMYSSSTSPVEILSNGAALHKLSRAMFSSYINEPQSLMTVAMRIAGLCKNGIALGVCEPEFWDTLDLAWEIILGSLNIAAGVQ